MMTRRAFLMSAMGMVAFRNDTLDLVERLVSRFEGLPEDEEFWVQIQQAFALDRTMINLNNGGVCPSPRVVQDALRRALDYGNQAPSYFMWRHLEPQIESVRMRLAKSFGCDSEEIAITRNASEALEICLFGFDLQSGDEILTTTQDYPRMINTIKQREMREGIKMVQARVPHLPRSHRELVNAIAQAITPKTKLILICHVIFLNGQIYPVREIVRLGKEHGIQVIVDGAHAFAHLPFHRDDLGCDYYGTSLHKWLLAPVGTGFLYVRKEKIENLWPLMAATAEQKKDIRKFEEIGTHPAANHNAIAEALTFHELIGIERKHARLRYLQERWTRKLRGEKNFRFHTNLGRKDSCGLITVEIEGIEPEKLANWLWDKKRIFVTTITNHDYKGIRVSPNVYTTVSEIDSFAEAMLEAARKGIG